LSAAAAALCLILGANTVTLPAERFTLAWTHSVEKTGWQEDYVVRDGRLVLTQARIEGTGAGMEPPPNAILQSGWWHYTPDLPPLTELRLTLSPYTADYRLCWNGSCRLLAGLVRAKDRDGTVVVRACDESGAPAVTTAK
jgi:hypothetical protein